VVLGIGVVGTVEGAVAGVLEVGTDTAGGGKRGAEGISGNVKPFSKPGGELLGVETDEASGDEVPGVLLLWWW
jgi:hypothetical protein